MPLVRSVTILWIAVVFAAPAAGQAISRGFELERLGRHEEAAAFYAAALEQQPGNEAALLGLERVLPRLGRTPELLAAARRARLAVPAAAVPRAVELRAFAELGALDSLRSAAAAWIAVAPDDEQPYREWVLALADHGRLDEARAVIRSARRELGRPDALATLAAELEHRAGDWPAAGREWRLVVTSQPAQRANAVYQLVEAPLDQRDGVLAALAAAGAPPAGRRLAAELLLAWGRPLDAWRLLADALDGPPAEIAQALWGFAERAGGIPGPGASRVRGLALVEYADRSPEAVAIRVRAEAARALLDGGDRAAARAQLQRIVGAPKVPRDARALAEAALIELLIRDGDLAAAHARLDDAAGEALAAEDAESLRRALAQAYVTRGDLAGAERVLGADASVAGAAARGWIALYRGELAVAESLFRRAGPYVGDRDDATARTAMLALLQVIGVERLPALGRALLGLARGDSAAAVGELAAVAAELAPRSRGGVLLLAGRVAARPAGDAAAALQLLGAAAADETGPFAPEADLVAARVLLRERRTAEAITRLEHLILVHPGSALAPEARRELERVRGAVPNS